MGTITDFDGNYSLEVPSGKNILVISYIGYKPQEVKVAKQKIVDVVWWKMCRHWMKW